jgi:triosephosphate isomerase
MSKIVIANLKMNMVLDDVKKYLNVINKAIDNHNVVICPTSIYTPYFLGHNYEVGLQNIYLENKGAYTGEISPMQAKSMEINYVLIGHSERRHILKEDNELIHKKLKAVISNNLVAVLCVGETLEEKNMLKTDIVLKRQLMTALSDFNIDNQNSLIIAYEPVWSIGTNKVPTNKEIETTIAYIKNFISVNFKMPNVPVLYGGSVNENNITELNKITNMSGVLVGGASLDPEKLQTIIKVVVSQ